MEYKQILNKVKALLSIEVILEQMKLADGVTTLEAEAFEPGYSVGIVTPEGIVPAPIGEHETADGMIIVVEVEGQILEVKTKATEEEVMPEAPIEASEPQMSAPKKTVETVSKETFFAEVKAEIETLENENKSLKAELSALKVELSQAAAKAIVHNPEPAVKRELTKLERYREIKNNLK
jgi:hypothetical protein